MHTKSANHIHFAGTLRFRTSKAILFVMLFSSACQIYLVPWQQAINQGNANLVIHQPVTIAPHRANIYIQDGKTMRYEQTDSYHANCNLVINEIQTQGKTLAPQRCAIKRFKTETALALNEATVAFVGLMDGGEFLTKEFTITFFLHCEKNPDILQLHCQHLDDVDFGNHLTLEQIQQTLGAVMSVTVDATP